MEKMLVLDQIDSAFSSVPAPEGWEKYGSEEDFEDGLGDAFLSEYWRDVYDRDGGVTSYILPFVMRYFLRDDLSVADTVNLEMFIMQLTPSVQHEIGLGEYFEEMYGKYSGEQKKAVHEWLVFLRKTKTLSGIDDAISFWAGLMLRDSPSR